MFNPKSDSPIPKNDLRKSSAISTLETIAGIILTLGGLASLFCMAAFMYGKGDYFLLYSLLGIFVTLLHWSFIKVFAEMANDIREIRENK